MKTRKEKTNDGLTGFYFLDRHVDIFQKGTVSLVLGRPAMGKTAFALNLTKAALLRGMKVCYVSFGLSSQKLMDWLKILGTEEDFLKNLHADDSLYSPMSVRKMADAIHHEYGDTNLIVIDEITTLGLASVQWLKGYFPDAAILLLSKVGRECEYREDHKIQITDVVDIEYLDPYLDYILALNREDYYRDVLDDERSNVMEVSLLKHKEGRTPLIVFSKIEDHFRITDYVL